MFFDLSVNYYNMDYLNETSHTGMYQINGTSYDLWHSYSDLPVRELSALDISEKVVYI